jgi:hypothetical protein
VNAGQEEQASIGTLGIADEMRGVTPPGPRTRHHRDHHPERLEEINRARRDAADGKIPRVRRPGL